MSFSVYLPPQAGKESAPLLWWLSGLTCTDQNFVTKAGAQRYTAESGIAIVCPDTSPRGDSVPGDPDGAWDFGHGAGSYVNATEKPWSTNYRMYDYIINELPQILGEALPIDVARQAISGHSMGGHGALVIGLRNADRFRSLSAFAPIASATRSPWGEKAFFALSRFGSKCLEGLRFKRTDKADRDSTTPADRSGGLRSVFPYPTEA